MVSVGRDKRSPVLVVSVVTLAAAFLVVVLLSAVLGTSPEFVGAQAIFFLAVLGFALTAKSMPLVVNTMFAVFLLKNFGLSQVIKLVLVQRADDGLAAPTQTAYSIAVAATGVVAGYVLASLFYRGRTPRGLVPSTNSLPRPLLVGYILSVIGLVSRIGATATMLGGEGSAVLVHLGEVTFIGVSVLIVAKRRKSNNRRVWSTASLAVLLCYMIAAIPSASKFDILKVPLFILLVYISLGRAPPARVLVLGITSLIFVMFVAHPIINHSRSVGGQSGMSTAEAYASAIGEVVADPTTLSRYNENSDAIEARWTTRLYYGKPLGFLGRFTPNQVDDMIVKGASIMPDPLIYVGRSILAAIPQAFGIQRSEEVGQSALERLGATTYRENLTSTNIGLVGELYVLGGMGAIFAGFMLVPLALTGIYWCLFGTNRKELLSIGLAMTSVLVVADGNLATLSILTVQGWLLLAVCLKSTALVVEVLPGSKQARMRAGLNGKPRA